MDVESRRQDDPRSGVAKALETTWGWCVRAPAMHAGDIDAAVLSSDACAVGARLKITWQWTKGSLPLRTDSISK